MLVLQVTAAAWLSSNFYLKIASFTYSIINTKSFSYFTEIKNYNKLTHGIKYLNVFSASYYPLALPLRKSFQYIPCSVVSTFPRTAVTEGPPLPRRGRGQHRTSPFRWWFQSYIHRKAPALGQGSHRLFAPVKVFLSETKQNKNENKTKPTHEKKRERKKKKTTKVLDHPQSRSASAARGGALAAPGAAWTRRPGDIATPRS